MKAQNLLKLKEKGLPIPFFQIVDEDKKYNKKLINSSKKYAIRSSASLEDDALTSFAGQFDTYLNISGSDIDEYLDKCFNSKNNEQVVAYAHDLGINPDTIKMQVIIQEMVQSSLSGILFTANPQGLLNEMVIVVGKGLGNNIVEDKVNTTTYYYNLTDNKYYYEGINYLTNEQIEELKLLAHRITDALGPYQDIEFAIQDNHIYILQARPITTIKGDHPLILDNSNIVESYPNITLPLTDSFVHMVYAGIFESVCRRILNDEEVINELKPVFHNMVGSSNGRMYYKISNWYHIIECLPFSKKIIPIWQDMLGVTNKEYKKERKIKGFKRFLTYFNFFKEFILVPKKMRQLDIEFQKIYTMFQEEYHDDITSDELINLYNLIKDKLLAVWDITLINDMYAFLFTGIIKNRLKKKYANYEEIANEYISGISNIESMKPILGLTELAYLKSQGIDITKLKEEYIRDYGDRHLEELKLESLTFRTNPELLDQKIDEYLIDQDKFMNTYKALREKKQNVPKKGLILRLAIKRATIGISNREKSRLNRSRIYGMVRTIFLKLGEQLKDNNVIQKTRDIFYLSIDEVFNLIKEPKNMDNLISERKHTYLGYKKLPSYSRLVFEDQEFNKTVLDINEVIETFDKHNLKGTPTSKGIVEGEVLVIDDIHAIPDVKDKILVTKMTDPGWVFLLATAKGIIAEKGSLLSHTAIISRELKIPSIVGVKNITKILKTGDIVRLDANIGSIEIIGDKDEMHML